MERAKGKATFDSFEKSVANRMLSNVAILELVFVVMAGLPVPDFRKPSLSALRSRICDGAHVPRYLQSHGFSLDLQFPPGAKSAGLCLHRCNRICRHTRGTMAGIMAIPSS